MPIISGSGTAAFPPGREIGYAQITAPVNVASTTESAGTTIISPGALAFDGGAVLCTVYFPYVLNGSTAAAGITVCLFEGATQIGRILALSVQAGTIQEDMSLTGLLRFTPTVGSHTYTVTAFASNTTGTPQCGAGAGGTGAFMPAFIRFTKV